MTKIAILLITTVSLLFAQGTKPTQPDVVIPQGGLTGYAAFTDSLVRAYLCMTYVDKTIFDYGPHAQDGSAVGTEFATDSEGEYLVFTPIDADYMDGGETGLSRITSQFTIIVRCRPNASLQGRNVLGRSVTTGVTNLSDWRIYMQGSVDRFDICFNTTSDVCFGNSTTTAFTVGNWYTYAASYDDADNDSVWAYLGGTRVYSAKRTTGGSVISTSNRKFFLARFGASREANVDIQFAFVWCRRLTNAEVSEYSNNPYKYFTASKLRKLRVH